MHYHPIKTLKKKGPKSLKRNSTGTYFDCKSSYFTWNCIKLEDIEKRLKNQDLRVKTTQRVYSAQSPILSGTIQIYLIMYDLVKYRWKCRSFYLFVGKIRRLLLNCVAAVEHSTAYILPSYLRCLRRWIYLLF